MLITLVSVVLYANSLNNAFHYDDFGVFVDNEAVKSLKNIPDFFKSVVSASKVDDTGYRPLLMTTFALNWRFGGNNPLGYHIVNLGVHILNGILVFLILGMLVDSSQNKAIPLVSAILFIMHPIHTEAINYIHARSSVLATFFILLSWFLFIKYNMSAKKRFMYYLGSLLSFVAAVLTKEIGFMLPFVLVLYDFYFVSQGKINDFKSRLLKQHSLFMILLAGYLFLRFFIVKNIEAPGGSNMTLQYLLTQLRVIMHYILLILYPINLSVERYVAMSYSIFQPHVIIPALGILLLFFTAIKLYRRSKLISFSILWFFLALAPVSSIIPMIIIMNSHRLYFPGVGVAIISAVLLCGLYNIGKQSKNSVFFRKMFTVLFGLILVFYSMRILKRNGDWKDEYSLWSKNIKVSPASFRSHNNLGSYYDRKGENEKAMREYEECLRLNPTSEAVFNNLGIVYYRLKMYDKAISAYKSAINLNNDYNDAHNNLGIVYAELGMIKESLEEFKKVIEVNPMHVETYKNIGIIYQKLGDRKNNLYYWKKYIELSPDAPPDRELIKKEVDKIETNR